MATYSYPDGGENDPRIETPELPEAAPAPEPKPSPSQTGEANPLQAVFTETAEALLTARAIWMLDRGSVEMPGVGDLIDDSLTELWALARLYRCDVRPTVIRIGPERGPEAVITLAEVLTRQAQQPAPLALATWFGNTVLQLMAILGR